MRKVNYKSDFDFIMRLKDASGKDVPWPDCDWDALFWTSSKAHSYTASCIGGKYVNCFREADGSIHFVFDNHRMAEYPYMYAVSFNAPTVTLSGADAYLCSDGYFTEESGTHKMPFAQEHYVIYYFRNRSFALTATAARYINEMCVYNGAPIVNFDRAEVRRLSIYGNEPFSTDNESAMRIYGGGFVDVAIETLEDGYMRIDSLNAVSLRLPNFKTLRGGFLILYCNYLQSLMLPALKSVVGGTVVNNAVALAVAKNYSLS